MTPLASVLTPIEEPLTAALVWLHTALGLSWAWAIVVLTVAVRVLIVPLAVKQIHSMQRLQVVAPQLKAIQQKYKHDKKRMNEEVMQFYRENKVNPAASCLPLLPQIPIFIALFYVLRDFEEEVWRPRFPGSDLHFLGIVPDITQGIGDHWSGWVLVVVYVVSQFASTFFMSTTMERTQRIVLLILPLAFAYFIVNPPGGFIFPVGLLLYWVTTNLWTVGQGLVTRRLIPKPEAAPKRTSRAEPQRPDEEPGDGARRPSPAPEVGPPAQRRVRRRKKKGPRARR